MQDVSKNNFVHVKSIFLLFVSLVLVSGCVSSSGPKFREEIARNDGKSTLYVYRTKDLLTVGTLPALIHNGQKIIPNFFSGTYSVHHIEPGTHTFEPKQFGLFKKDTVTLENTKSGETYYVQLKVSIGYIGLIRMAPATALSEIRNCTLIGGTKGASSSPSPTTSEKKTLPTVTSEPVREQAEMPMVSSDGAEPTNTRTESVGIVSNPTASVSQSFLYVNASPVESKIRVLNIGPKFKQGIELVPGRYHIETSAPGYVTDKRWISIEPGGHTSKIQLSPAKLSVVKQPAKVSVVKQPAVELVRADFSSEAAPYVKMLRSNNPLQKRDAAKIIYRSYPHDTAIMEVVNAELLNGYKLDTSNKYQIDAMSWLCKVLGNSGEKEYLSTLQQIANESSNRKLKKYALKSATFLKNI